MSYSMDYSEAAPRQSNPHAAFYRDESAPVPEARPARQWAIPSIVKTFCTFVAAGALFMSAEKYAPPEWRPSTVMGTYDGRIASAVKAAELQQQAKYEVWAAGLKVSAEQQVEQYKATAQSILGYQNATYDRLKIVASAAMQVQTAYIDQQTQLKRQQQSTDVTVINLARLWGRAADYLEPGSGQGALDYANDLSGELSDEITEAVKSGARVDITGWDYNLPTPDAARPMFEQLKPLQLPPPPALADDAPRLDGPRK